MYMSCWDEVERGYMSKEGQIHRSTVLFFESFACSFVSAEFLQEYGLNPDGTIDRVGGVRLICSALRLSRLALECSVWSCPVRRFRVGFESRVGYLLPSDECVC